MPGPNDKTRRWMRAAAIPAALAVSALIVWQASYSAFSGTTDSPGNQWSTGSVSLQNDTTGSYATTGTLMFNPGAVAPGDSGSWCVNVKNNGTTAGTAGNPIKFFAPLPANLSTNTLAQNLTLTVTESTTALTGGAAGSCTGFTALGTPTYNGLISALPATYTAATAPAGTGLLAAGATRGYKLTWTLPSSAPNTLQNQSLTGVDFAWSLQVGS
ncbi:MAG: hypothetical protein J0I11_07165 [Actinobacteria bacterium]|jgi:hypothetical protein|nr:hypothetical protein [Actinomycetota bacterium]